MKKLLFAMTLSCCYLLGIAQDNITAEQAKAITANTMANFTQSVSFAYTKGISLGDFRKKLCGKATPLDAGNGMIETAYSYLSNGVTKDRIIKENDGIAVAKAFRYLYDQHNRGVASSDGSELFGGKENLANSQVARAEDCRWYQFWCHVQVFANWVVQNWPTIQQILIYLLGL
ncbi:MAG: hypothetical protein ABI741_00925 [Ferruginibacter sp.]